MGGGVPQIGTLLASRRPPGRRNRVTARPLSLHDGRPGPVRHNSGRPKGRPDVSKHVRPASAVVARRDAAFRRRIEALCQRRRLRARNSFRATNPYGMGAFRLLTFRTF